MVKCANCIPKEVQQEISATASFTVQKIRSSRSSSSESLGEQTPEDEESKRVQAELKDMMKSSGNATDRITELAKVLAPTMAAHRKSEHHVDQEVKSLEETLDRLLGIQVEEQAK